MIARNTTLRLDGARHAHLQAHLFPGDGLEAAAVLICARAGRRRSVLIVRDMVLVPYAACAERARDHLTWPGSAIEEAVDRAERFDDALVLVHSHPGGLFAFSPLDDRSDATVMPALAEALPGAHGSAIMTPDGAMRARLYDAGAVREVDLVAVAGDTVRLFWSDRTPGEVPALAFTSNMTREAERLAVCIVGVSGTGSLVAEQACRMGFGEVGLVDPDRVELRNLNRIVNATVKDARAGVAKVERFAAAVGDYAPAVETRAFTSSILDRDAVLAAGEADLLICCVDSHEGRQVCDLIASVFGLPLIDLGVQIPLRTDASGIQSIAGVFGRIDYVQPGGSRLEDREVYSPQTLLAEHLARVAPDQHAREVGEGYIRGRAEEAPSVIALNMRAASAAMMEVVARLWPYRSEPDRDFARTVFDLASGEEDHWSEDAFTSTADALANTGEREPLLGLPVLKPLPKGSGR